MNTGEQLIGSEQEVNGYRFEKIIGRDPAGRLIFRAINYKRHRVAVKIISLIQLDMLDSSIEEAIFLTDLNHPNITESFEFMVRRQNTELLVFGEYIEQNLAKHFKFMSEAEIIKCALGIIEAVAYLHETMNSVHSDIRLQSVQLVDKKIPKLSFYNLDWENQVSRDCYFTKQLARQYNQKGRIHLLKGDKADDAWALGLLLLQLFSKKRVTQILGLDSRNGHEVSKQFYHNSRHILQCIKFPKISQLIQRLLIQNPEKRPSIADFLKDFQAVVQDPDFSVVKQIKDPAIRTKKGNRSENPAQKKKAIQQKYQQIIQRTSRKTNSDAFQLQDVKDRLKLKILNLSEMKITRIQPINNLPNLEWLYLQNNQIRRIENLDYARLKGLHLASNMITKIEGLDRLTSLQQLYLDHNEITKIQNLNQLRNLKWLYLSHNRIVMIENLEQLIALKTVVLRHNPIGQFQRENVIAVKMLKKNGIQVVLQ